MASLGEEQRGRMRRRALVAAALLAIGYIGVGARLGYLQVIKRDGLQARALKQQNETVELPPRRGTIYDRNGRELAVSIDADSLYAVPASVDDPRAVAAKLAPVLGADRAALTARLSGSRRFAWIARKVAPDVPEKVDTSGEFAGMLGWVTDCRRYYPKKTLASHVLGFTGMDDRGLEGIEAFYERYVGGVAGKAVTERDGAGKEVLSVDDGYSAPKTGCNIKLTLDENIQYAVERELDSVMEKCGPASVTAIVMNPKTGEILALANRPTFNPNSRQGTKPASWRDRAVTDTYEPGSTFKVVTAAAALEEGVVTPAEIIDCGDGEITIGDRTVHNAHKEGGRKSFAEVIQKSDNVGTIRVALRLGPKRLYKYARAFGIGGKTGVDLPGEVSGRLREPDDWSGSSIASVAIGQEVSVTAIEMLSAVNCIANGGYLVKPYVVSEIRSEDGSPVMQAEPAKAARVISEATAKKLARILGTVVEEGGTAIAANIKGYQVAGKTGTAQKYDPALRRYSEEKYTSSFVGFVPADDPKLSAIVVVNEPKGVHYGGLVAAPAFKTIMEKSLTYMKVPTRLPEQTVLVER